MVRPMAGVAVGSEVRSTNLVPCEGGTSVLDLEIDLRNIGALMRKKN